MFQSIFGFQIAVQVRVKTEPPETRLMTEMHRYWPSYIGAVSRLSSGVELLPMINVQGTSASSTATPSRIACMQGRVKRRARKDAEGRRAGILMGLLCVSSASPRPLR